MAGVRRGGRKGKNCERRARKAWKDRTREDRAHFDFPFFSTACHAGYLEPDNVNI